MLGSGRLDATKQQNLDAWRAWRSGDLQQPNTPLRHFVTGLERDRVEAHVVGDERLRGREQCDCRSLAADDRR
jgi:ferric-dicitrate binding protein FerR (iron transport regulator)